MSSTPRLLFILLLVPACLDATPGGADAGPTDGAPPDGSCGVTPPDIAFVSRDIEPNGFALGPCGVLAYWVDTSSDRQLIVVGADHREITRVSFAERGYDGEIGFSPTGRRLWATTRRSDLGNGDLFLGDLSTTSRLEGAGTLQFGGEAIVRFDEEDALVMIAGLGGPGGEPYLIGEEVPMLYPLVEPTAAGDHFFYAHGHELTVRDISSGATRIVAPLLSDWLEGSTQRSRQSYLVAADGSRIVATSISQPYGEATTPSSYLLAIYDSATGTRLYGAEHHPWRSPAVGATGLVAADSETGVAIVAPDATVSSVPGHTLAAVLADHVLTRDADVLWAVTPGSAELVDVVGQPSTISVSAGGRAAAILHGADSARDLTLWVDGRVSSAGSIGPFDAILHVEDDGTTLARVGAEIALIGPTGWEVLRWQTTCARSPQRHGSNFWIELCDAPNDELHVVDVWSARDTLIAEGHDFVYKVDRTSQTVAFTFVPLSGTRRELRAGVVPRPARVEGGS